MSPPRPQWARTRRNMNGTDLLKEAGSRASTVNHPWVAGLIKLPLNTWSRNLTSKRTNESIWERGDLCSKIETESNSCLIFPQITCISWSTPRRPSTGGRQLAPLCSPCQPHCVAYAPHCYNRHSLYGDCVACFVPAALPKWSHVSAETGWGTRRHLTLHLCCMETREGGLGVGGWD